MLLQSKGIAALLFFVLGAGLCIGPGCGANRPHRQMQAVAVPLFAVFSNLDEYTGQRMALTEACTFGQENACIYLPGHYAERGLRYAAIGMETSNHEIRQKYLLGEARGIHICSVVGIFRRAGVNRHGYRGYIDIESIAVIEKVE